MIPTDRSRLAKVLAAETGLSLVWVYRCLNGNREPLDQAAAKIWRRVVDREARRAAKRRVTEEQEAERRAARMVGTGRSSSSCPQRPKAGAV